MTWDSIPHEAIVFAGGLFFLAAAAGLSWVAMVTADSWSSRRGDRRK